MAVEAGVRRLIGFHHDPNHDDELIELHFQKALEYQRRHYPHSDLIVNVGYEGLQVELPGE
jgi:hypothetical protein